MHIFLLHAFEQFNLAGHRKLNLNQPLKVVEKRGKFARKFVDEYMNTVYMILLILLLAQAAGDEGKGIRAALNF